MWIAALTILGWVGYGIARSRRSDIWHYFLLSLGILATVGTLLGIYLSMFIFWTHPSSSTIDGVQGRYMIPLVFLITPLIFSSISDAKLHVKALVVFVVMTGTTISFLLNDVIPFFY